MKRFIAFVVAAVLGISAFAGDKLPATQARIDIGGKCKLKPVKAEGGHVSNINWAKKKEDNEKALTGSSFSLKRDGDWTVFKVTFTPEKDGYVSIALRGNWTPKAKGKKNMDQHWVFYDKITVDGATIVNGDFEETKDGKLVGWKVMNKKSYITSGEKAFSGKAMVKVWHNESVYQSIKVKAGQEVTITANVKFAEYKKAEK